MKKSLSIVAGLSFLAVSNSFGTVWQSDGTVESVQYIHNYQAAAGDTITIPTGSFHWSTLLTLTKRVTLKGNTIVTDTDLQNGTSTDNTIILRDSPITTQSIVLSGTQGQRLTGISFIQGTAAKLSNALIGIPQSTGVNPVRIDHCVFDGVKVTPVINVAAQGQWGIVDHCVKRNQYNNEGLVHCYNGGGSTGDWAYAQDSQFGTNKFFFVETNWLDGGCDVSYGGRVVFWHNWVLGASFGSHGMGVN